MKLRLTPVYNNNQKIEHKVKWQALLQINNNYLKINHKKQNN